MADRHKALSYGWVCTGMEVFSVQTQYYYKRQCYAQKNDITFCDPSDRIMLQKCNMNEIKHGTNISKLP